MRFLSGEPVTGSGDPVAAGPTDPVPLSRTPHEQPGSMVDPGRVRNDGGVHTRFRPGMAITVDLGDWSADAEVTFVVATRTGAFVHYRIDVDEDEVVRGSVRLPEELHRLRIR